MRYKYKVTGPQDQKQLNKLGKKGWRLVAMQTGCLVFVKSIEDDDCELIEMVSPSPVLKPELRSV